ncbi:DUF4180 domain-containing protein [Chromobacterium violaceum]|uniref:DUF4180 domain-containing protein n=1 Tax=Chromobacterium violaceum TaxID=536 RepID=UPI00385FEA3B
MTYQILLSGKHRVLEWRGELSDASQAAELISACIGEDCARLLIPREALSEAFFQLSSRFAGEFLREAKRGRYSRLFLERDEAMDWLATC